MKALSRYIESCLSLGVSVQPQSFSQHWLYTLQELQGKPRSATVPQNCWFTLRAHHRVRSIDSTSLQHSLKAHACGYEGLTEFLGGYILWNSRGTGVIKGHILRCELRVLYDSRHEILFLLPQSVPTRVELTPLGMDLLGSQSSAHSWILQPGVTPSKAIDRLLADLSLKIHPHISYSSSFHPRTVSTDCPSLTMAPAIRTLLSPARPFVSLGRRIISALEDNSTSSNQLHTPRHLVICTTGAAPKSTGVQSADQSQQKVLVITSASASQEAVQRLLNKIKLSRTSTSSLAFEQRSSRILRSHDHESTDLFLRALKKLRVSQKSTHIQGPRAEDTEIHLKEVLRKRKQYEWIEGILRPGQLPRISPLSSELLERIKTLPTSRVSDFREGHRLISSLGSLSKEIFSSKLFEILNKLERIQRSLSPRQEVQYLAFLFQELPTTVRHEALTIFNKCYSIKKQEQGLTGKLAEQLCAPPGFKVSAVWKRRSRQTTQLLHELTNLHHVEGITVDIPEDVPRHLIVSAGKELSRPSRSLLSKISRSRRKAWALVKKVRIDRKRVSSPEQLQNVLRYLRRDEILSRLSVMWQDSISNKSANSEQMLSEVTRAHHTLLSLCPLRDQLEELYREHFESYSDSFSEVTTTTFHMMRRALADSVGLERKRSIDEFLVKWKKRIESIESSAAENSSIKQLLSSLEQGAVRDIKKNLKALKQELDDYHILREARAEMEQSGILKPNVIKDFSDPQKIPDFQNKLDAFPQAYEWKYKLQSLLNLFVEETETELVLGLLQNLNRDCNPHEQVYDHAIQSSQSDSNVGPTIEVKTLEELLTSRNLPLAAFDEVYALLEEQDLGYAGILFAFAPVVRVVNLDSQPNSIELSKVAVHFSRFFPEGMYQSERAQESPAQTVGKRRVSSTVTLHPLEVMNLAGTHPLHIRHLNHLGFDADEIVFSDTIQAVRIRSSRSSVVLLYADWDRLDDKSSLPILQKLARYGVDKGLVFVPLTSQGLVLLKHDGLFKAFLSAYGAEPSRALQETNHSETTFDDNLQSLQQYRSAAEDFIHPSSLKTTAERRNSGYFLLH